MLEAARNKELMCRNIVFEHIGIELMEVEHMLGIIAQQSQSLATITLAPTGFIDDNAHLGPTIRGTEVKEVDSTDQLSRIATLDHQPRLLVHIEVMAVGLDILL